MARVLRSDCSRRCSVGVLIRADTIDTLTRLAGALSLFASFRIGRPNRWRHAREKLLHVTDRVERSARRQRNASRPKTSRKRVAAWADALVAALWMALLLFVVGYVALKGESAMAELDGLDLVATYALEP